MRTEHRKNGLGVQLRLGDGKRTRFVICAPTATVAKQRAEILREMATLLVRSGREAEAESALETLAGAYDADAFEGGVAGIREICAESVEQSQPRPGRAVTFRDFGQRWTSGELHERHPGHVRAKKSTKDDLSKLEWHYKTIGHVPLASFTLDDADRAMSNLPATTLSNSTRRHYAQVIAYLFKLALYPCRLIATNPIPKGFTPKASKPPAFPFLYPSEDRRLLACELVDLELRAFFGFCVREGMRASEPLGLTWRHFDLDHPLGIVTTNLTKSDDVRTWPLFPGTRDALLALKKLRGESKDTDLVFRNLGRADDLAEKLRASLKVAGVNRTELYDASEGREPLRFHDLRGSFITIALANHRSEAWITDRTGHTTSQMLYRYKKKARRVAELELGDWSPLDAALGLAPRSEAAAPPALPEPTRVAPRVAHEVARKVSEEAVSDLELAELAHENLVGRRGLEPRTYGLKELPQTAPGDADSRIQADRCAPVNAETPSVPPISGGVAHGFGLDERELTRLHELASRAKDWALAAKLAERLEALARDPAPAPAKVSSLADARKRRDEKDGGQ